MIFFLQNVIDSVHTFHCHKIGCNDLLSAPKPLRSLRILIFKTWCNIFLTMYEYGTKFYKEFQLVLVDVTGAFEKIVVQNEAVRYLQVNIIVHMCVRFLSTR